MRLSRGCYDKFHRCPGWAGGGTRYAKVNRCPMTGHLLHPYRGRFWYLKFRRCEHCDVLVLPHFTRWLDPTWLRTVRN